MAKPSNLLGSVLADNVDAVASGINAGITNDGRPPEDSPMDVFQPIFISRHPAETSVTGVLGTVPWQLVSRSQQVLLEDKQDTSRAQGVQLHSGTVLSCVHTHTHIYRNASNVYYCTILKHTRLSRLHIASIYTHTNA